LADDQNNTNDPNQLQVAGVRRGRFQQGYQERQGRGLGMQAASAARDFYTGGAHSGHTTAGNYYAQAPDTLPNAVKVVSWTDPGGKTHYGSEASRDAWIASYNKPADATPAPAPKPAPAPAPQDTPAPQATGSPPPPTNPLPPTTGDGFMTGNGESGTGAAASPSRPIVAEGADADTNRMAGHLDAPAIPRDTSQADVAGFLNSVANPVSTPRRRLV
jgi:hypothetical protein